MFFIFPNDKMDMIGHNYFTKEFSVFISPNHLIYNSIYHLPRRREVDMVTVDDPEEIKPVMHDHGDEIIRRGGIVIPFPPITFP